MGYWRGLHANNGSWRTNQHVHIKDGGTWRDCKYVYIKDGGVWRKVFEYHHDLITEGTTYTSPEQNFHSRDGAPAQGYGYFKFDTTNGWMTRSWVHQDSGGFTADSGWITGSSSASANQADAKVCIPTKDSSHSVPIVMMQGDHYSGEWFCIWDYSGVITNVEDATSEPAGWIGNHSTGC